MTTPPTGFVIYPGIDDEFGFPPEVRQALANSPEIIGKISTMGAGKISDTQKGVAGGVAQLDSGTKIPLGLIPTSVQKGELFIRAEDYTTFQAALDAGAAAKKDVIFSSVWNLTSGITWQANQHSIRGYGDARLDFTAMSSGTAFTVVGLGTMDYTIWEFMGEIHTASGFQIRGPETEGTTVDGISITTDTSKVSHINFDHLYVKGFRDQVILGNNTWCVTFNEVLLNKAKRRAVSIIGTVNCGENYSFHGCTIANASNASNNAVGIYTDVNSQFLGVNFFGVSLDYCDILFDHYAGTLSFHGCHWENNKSQAMGFLSYTAGKARTALNMNGCVVDPSETRPGRSHLIEVRSTSGGGVHVTGVGNTFRLYDRPVHVLKNLSSSSPLVRWYGGALDNSVLNDVASYGHYTSQIINGDMEGALSFIATAQDEGGWWRQGTVTYSFATDDFKSGTQSIKMVGTGVTGSTGCGQTFRVQPKTVLSFCAYLKTVLTSGSVQFRLTWRKADKSALQTIILNTISASQGWTPYGYAYMVPVGAVFGEISFVNVDLNGTAWFDEVIATVL